MPKPRNAVHVFVAACSLALAACQPAEAPAERSIKSVDSAASKIVAQIDRPAGSGAETFDGAKK